MNQGTQGFVGYYRVSTTKQGASGLGLEAQKEAVRAFIASRGGHLIESYTEIESGKVDDRPKLTEAMGRCRVHDATLVIAKLDRLSRDAAFLLRLQKEGARFVAADMPEANNLTIGLLAVVAQHEREMISARTKAALAAAKARGRKLGGRRTNTTVTNEARAKASQALQKRIQKRTTDLAPVVRGLQAEGVTSLNGLARALTERSIPTPLKTRTWTATQVGRLLKQIEALSSENGG